MIKKIKLISFIESFVSNFDASLVNSHFFYKILKYIYITILDFKKVKMINESEYKSIKQLKLYELFLIANHVIITFYKLSLKNNFKRFFG